MDTNVLKRIIVKIGLHPLGAALKETYNRLSPDGVGGGITIGGNSFLTTVVSMLPPLHFLDSSSFNAFKFIPKLRYIVFDSKILSLTRLGFFSIHPQCCNDCIPKVGCTTLQLK